MLNRHEANIRLKQAIQKLKPDWQDELEINPARPAEHAVSLYYIDELLKILPDYPPPPKPAPEAKAIANESKSAAINIVPTAAGADTNKKPLAETAEQREQRLKVEALRRKLRNILDNETYLNFKTEHCDIIFAIELELAKLFPINERVLTDDQGAPLAKETWEDIVCEQFTRETSDLIVFSRTYLLKRATAVQYFQSQCAFSATGEILGMDHNPLSTREIASLLQQGIMFPESQEVLAPENLEELRLSEQTLMGGLMRSQAGIAEVFGLYIGLMVSMMFVVGSLMLTPVGIVAPALLFGVITAYAAGTRFIEGFFIGVSAMMLFGGLALQVAQAVIFTLVSSSMLPVAAAAAIEFMYSTLIIPVAVPILLTATVGARAWFNEWNFATTVHLMAVEFFLYVPTALFVKLGMVIDNVVISSIEFISRCLGYVIPDQVEQEQAANSLSSHSQISILLGTDQLQPVSNVPTVASSQPEEKPQVPPSPAPAEQSMPTPEPVARMERSVMRGARA